jgi:hypothetical protein
MIRRRPKDSRRISARRQSLIAYYRRCGLPKFPKGATPAAVKRQKRETRSVCVVRTRIRVWLRSRGACEFCGDRERDTWRRLAAEKSARPGEHHLDEVFITRAKGRGLPPADLFNERNCARVCPFCHDLHHAGRLSIEETVPGAGCTKLIRADLISSRRDAAPLPAWATELLTRKQPRP